MALPIPDRPLLRHPPIRSPRAYEPDDLAAVVARSRPWFRYPHELPRRVTGALWTVLVGAGTFGAWLLTTPSGGLVHRIVTLGHPRLLLALAAVCVATLLVLAPLTHGLTRAGGPGFAVMVIGGAAGVAALLGVAVLALLTVLAAAVALAAVVAVFEGS